MSDRKPTVVEPPPAPADTRKPSAAAVAAAEHARQAAEAGDPLPDPGQPTDTRTCTACGRPKAPIGRDVPAAMHGDLCTEECYAYRWPPTPPSDWTTTRQMIGRAHRSPAR